MWERSVRSVRSLLVAMPFAPNVAQWIMVIECHRCENANLQTHRASSGQRRLDSQGGSEGPVSNPSQAQEVVSGVLAALQREMPDSRHSRNGVLVFSSLVLLACRRVIAGAFLGGMNEPCMSRRENCSWSDTATTPVLKQPAWSTSYRGGPRIDGSTGSLVLVPEPLERPTS